MTLQIHTNSNTLSWPYGQELSDEQIMDELDISLSQNGQTISRDHISINKKAVDPNQVGVYVMILTAVGADNDYATKEIQVWVNQPFIPPEPGNRRYKNSSKSQRSTSQKNPKPKTKKRAWKIAAGIIAIFLLIFIGISACQAHNDQVQNEQAQSSALDSANSQLDTLGQQNKELQNQVSDLRSAVNQYKDDSDKQALQNQLDDLKQQNQQLKQNSTNNQALQNQIDQLGSAIDQIKNNPSQADSAINQLQQNQNQFLQSIQNTFQKMLSDIQQLFNR